MLVRQNWSASLSTNGRSPACEKNWVANYICQTIYVTCDNLCFRLTRDDVTEEDNLKTSQEEADTRVIFHTKHATPNVSSIIMVAEDTDIQIQKIQIHSSLPSFSQRCTQQCVCEMWHSYSNQIYQHLQSASCPGPWYVYFSSQITFIYRMWHSAFNGQGKLAALKLLMTHNHLQDVFIKLRDKWQLAYDIF